VSTSRYWFNYRHTANALSLYHTVKVGQPHGESQWTGLAAAKQNSGG